MADEFRVKVFRSGNSLAVRLPKALGIAEGEDMKVVAHDDGSLSFWRKADSLKVLMSLYGAFSPGFMSHGRGDIGQEERDWSDGHARGEAA